MLRAAGEGAATIPHLAGQHPGYIAEQLDNFISMARANEVMRENSKALSPQEIQELAAYVGSLQRRGLIFQVWQGAAGDTASCWRRLFPRARSTTVSGC